MKLIVGTKEDFNGYKNLGLSSLDEIDTGECEEIRAIDICDYQPINELESYIKNLVSKLQHGGKIVIGGLDYLLLFKSANVLSVGEVNQLVFTPDAPKKRGFYTLPEIVNILNNLGLQIVRQGFHGMDYYVEATRP